MMNEIKSKSDFINEWKPYIDAMATGIAFSGCTIESDEELAEIIKKEIEEYNSNQEESKEELEDYQIDWLVEEIRETEKEAVVGNNRIGTLELSGDTAINFVNSFFFPTKEDIAQRIEMKEERNRHISISQTKNGFDAEIGNFDLPLIKKN